jgi:hypothetical protein
MIRISAADITAIAVRRFDPLKTLGLLAGITAGAAIGCAVTSCLDFEIGNLSTSARRVP